jgi:hypothetical protein
LLFQQKSLQNHIIIKSPFFLEPTLPAPPTPANPQEMPSSPRDRSSDSLFDSFDTPPRPPHTHPHAYAHVHASGSNSSVPVVPPAPSRPGYGRVVPTRSTTTAMMTTTSTTTGTRHPDDNFPARSSSSSSSPTGSEAERNLSSNITRRDATRPSSPPDHHYLTGPSLYEDNFRDHDDQDDNDDEESGSYRGVPDHSTSRSDHDHDHDDDDDDDDDDEPESEESESELSILHKIGLLPPPSTLPNGSQPGKLKSRVEHDDDEDQGRMHGVDDGFRTSWLGPREVKGMRVGPRLTDRGVGFEGVGESLSSRLWTSQVEMKRVWLIIPSHLSFIDLRDRRPRQQTTKPTERSSTINSHRPHSSSPPDPTSIDHERPHPLRPMPLPWD